MKNTPILFFVRCLTILFFFNMSACAENKADSNPTAVITTNMGKMTVQLFPKAAPKTVANFIEYANQKFYDETVFHRVIPNFMIQGGGFTQDYAKKQTGAPIVNEASPSLPNVRGSISMARTSDPHSATSQFFINVVDNHFLNKTSSNPGYAVFGQVIEGIDVADKIASVKTGTKAYMRDVPNQNVVIQSITISK